MINANQLAFLQSMMDHPMTAAELSDFVEHHGDDQYLVIDERPREGRKIMLYYCACNGRVLRDYIQTYRPDVYEKYYLVQLYVHSLAVQFIWKNSKAFPWIIAALFNHCDVLVYNPVGSNYDQFSDQNVLRYLNHSAVALSYNGNYQGCWFSICPLFGEECLWKYYRRGQDDAEIFSIFENGSFDCEFPERFKSQMSWIKGREDGTDVRLEKFIAAHYRECKMFFTSNHPTYNCNAYIMDQLLEKLGFKLMGDDHCLSLPSDRCMLSDQYPETHYEFSFYQFQYPMRYQNGHGGMAFFKKLITDARQRWTEKGKP